VQQSVSRRREEVSGWSRRAMCYSIGRLRGWSGMAAGYRLYRWLKEIRFAWQSPARVRSVMLSVKWSVFFSSGRD